MCIMSALSSISATIARTQERMDHLDKMRRMEMITPKDYVGKLMELAQQRRGDFVDMQFLTEARTTISYDLPLAEVSHADL